MAADPEPAVYDLIIITSLPSIISVSALTGCFGRIGLLGYCDYDTVGVVAGSTEGLIEWSGWLDPAAGPDSEDAHALRMRESQPDLLGMAKKMDARAGWDWPEALKTALAHAQEVARPEATATLALLYADAPPHLQANSGWSSYRGCLYDEQEALKKSAARGGNGGKFLDWVSACTELAQGDKKFQVFSLLPLEMNPGDAGCFQYLSALTGGATILLWQQRPEYIAEVSVAVLLTWMGVAKPGVLATELEAGPGAFLTRYRDLQGIEHLRHEDDEAAARFFVTSLIKNQEDVAYREDMTVAKNVTNVGVTDETLAQWLPKKQTPVGDLTKAWAADPAYRAMAIRHLAQIIREDVQAIALNPVFGSLWRAFCSDRQHPLRDSLTAEFSMQVERLSDPDDKARMKKWLEESYNYAAETRSTIEQVPAEEHFPCVFLDPTLKFETEAEGDGSEPPRPITDFTRAELLEIGRSCDPRILARLSKILTRLTYVESESDLPAHIGQMTGEQVPRIPLVLAKKQHGSKFWKLLFHLIVPGTQLSARPATLLAGFSLTLGIPPLMEAAETQMMAWRTRWNDTEIPENWNASCLSLLMDADQAYRTRHITSEGLLPNGDREIYEKLVAFHILSANLEEPLEAQVGWTPNKSAAPLGPLAICAECRFPRSVTIMQNSGVCGVCAATFESAEEAQLKISRRVTKDQDEKSTATWVECRVPTCRAQYVVYNVESLNVSPKCHYCRLLGSLNEEQRAGKEAPCVECSKCRNRMIWPTGLRAHDFSEASFLCPPCHSDRQTVVTAEASAWDLCRATEDMSWLVADNEDPSAFALHPQAAQSIFKLVTMHGAGGFGSRFSVLPGPTKPLLLDGKPVHNAAAIVEQLRALVASRHVGRDTCSMCFETFRRAATQLLPACGRRGCAQRACLACMRGWYGLNGPGRVINPAALACPFCRRLAAPRHLSRFGNGVHAAADLATALRDQGAWVHAWCFRCGHARPMVARECARGPPPDVQRWVCDGCREDAEAQARRLRLEEAAAAAVDAGERERLRQEAQAAEVRVRECPGCGVATEKTAGCDHIACPACGAHWCFFCGQVSSEAEIYTHMTSKHGGWYEGEMPWSDAELDEDEDDDEW